MFEFTTLILVGVACLIIGSIIGALLSRSLSPQDQQNRQLESRLQESENKLRDYQNEVSEHFAETSQKVNKLTQSYKEVHEFLASSALKLTNPDISRQLIDAADGKLLDSKPDSGKPTNDPEQPKDWAPKSPGQMGQLSEGYGLEPNVAATDKPVRP